jgi:ADP-dependent NAD(P)H-hydrate dehydratase / NAD(P)H-hydrate epimerase
MKIFNANQIKTWDKFTLEQQQISSLQLMERAVLNCLPIVLKNITFKNTIFIFCGNGNNGGDGLVLGRFLHDLGYKTSCVVFEETTNLSPENTINRKRIKDTHSLVIVKDIKDIETLNFDDNTVIIDAIFGNGLNRILEGFYAVLITALNEIKCHKKISIDIPSGLLGDVTQLQKNQVVFKADLTLSFQQTKTSFLFDETGFFTGEVVIIDINLSKGFEQKENTNFYFFDRKDAAEIFEKKAAFESKHSYGHLLLIGGDSGKSGAIMMAANAANYSGCGRITVSTTKESASFLQMNSPQAMVFFNKENSTEISVPKLSEFSAIAIGPGLGKEEEKVQLVRKIINDFKGPILFDADAISILAENKTWLAFLTPNSILTPHQYELQKLTGISGDRTTMLSAAVELAVKNKIIVVYKGKNTAICLPNGDVVFNSSGNQALSKGGSGDLLTGFMGGLLAKGYSPACAAMLACYMHGKAAEYALQHSSIDGMTFKDILNGFNEIVSDLEN